MQLAEIELEGVRRLPRLAWNLSGQRLVFLTGAPAAGKSSALRAIAGAKEACAPYGMGAVRLDRFVDAGRTAKIRLRLSLTEEEQRASQLDEPRVELECALGSTRSQSALSLRAKRLLSDSSGAVGRICLLDEPLALPAHPTLRAAEDAARSIAEEGSAKLLGIHALVSDPERSADRSRVNRLLAATGLGLELRGVTTRTGLREPEIAVSGIGEPLPLSRLSSTEKSAALLALLFVAQGPRDSIVLWDAPERGLGPAAARVLGALQAFEPSNQLIVATGSAGLVAAYPQAVAAELAPVNP